MAIYNTASDAANTAVRSFLTKVGEFYLDHSLITGSGRGKFAWLRIRDQVFDGCCAYCGDRSDHLQIEHLLMFNHTEYDLHHPGNIVPYCRRRCNKRERNEDNTYTNWVEHLKLICIQKNELNLFKKRKLKIETSMRDEEVSNFK